MSSISKILRTAQCFGFKTVSYFLLAIHCLVDFVTSFWKEGFRLLWRNVSRGGWGPILRPNRV